MPWRVAINSALLIGLEAHGNRLETRAPIGFPDDNPGCRLLLPGILQRPLQFRLDFAPPMPTPTQQIRFCTSADGVRIAYTTSGAGPPLVEVAPG